MTRPVPLLIIWHSRTGGARAMAAAVKEGAGVDGRIMPCEEAEPDDLLAAQGYVFVCPENLATMSGAMKEFFDRCYYPVLGRIEGRAYATAIAAGSDGEGATRQIDRIVTGWRLRRVADPLIVNFAAQTPEEVLRPKSLPSKSARDCFELGQAMGQGLAMGVF
ncbi:MAG TPA: NAD(P)H-dependent oxidoreductase [Croceicoccus sp.]|nr:NAD(P)H-dependent oxidoreductase [Croceicoccus sp.]